MTVEIREYVEQYPGQTPLPLRAELAAAIQDLKRSRGAVILAHNYQLPEIQDLADYL